jgi:hypothetical protein
VIDVHDENLDMLFPVPGYLTICIMSVWRVISVHATMQGRPVTGMNASTIDSS